MYKQHTCLKERFSANTVGDINRVIYLKLGQYTAHNQIHYFICQTLSLERVGKYNECFESVRELDSREVAYK